LKENVLCESRTTIEARLWDGCLTGSNRAGDHYRPLCQAARLVSEEEYPLGLRYELMATS